MIPVQRVLSKGVEQRLRQFAAVGLAPSSPINGKKTLPNALRILLRDGGISESPQNPSFYKFRTVNGSSLSINSK